MTPSLRRIFPGVALESTLVWGQAATPPLVDSGAVQVYKDWWDGNRFRLFSADSMSECRGSQQTITTERAAVAPRCVLDGTLLVRSVRML
jgi:hypothetical protein